MSSREAFKAKLGKVGRKAASLGDAGIPEVQPQAAQSPTPGSRVGSGTGAGFQTGTLSLRPWLKWPRGEARGWAASCPVPFPSLLHSAGTSRTMRAAHGGHTAATLS